MSTEQNIEVELRQVRLERKAKTQVSADDGQGWAVSYSDILMVLMSFFVIFFSFDGKHKESLVSKIAIEMVSKADKTAKDAPSEAGISTASDLKIEEKVTPQISKIEEHLRSQSISSVVSPDTGQLTIDLSDQIYPIREFAVNNELKTELNLVLDILAPYMEDVRIVFVGHSDNAPLQMPGKYLSNNLDLSSLRASRALSFAIERGFDARKLAIEAVASNVRNSRSLSVKIIQDTN